MTGRDISQDILARVTAARSTNTKLNICAGHSKSFYGRPSSGEQLDISGHTGVINYEPTELAITARAGTGLKEIEAVLDSENQMLAFEPPAFGKTASIGGTVACGFSGPRRAYAGSARDFILGSSIINGKAEQIHFGGEVMKNVAGYDISRLMCGAMGTLGVLLDVSIKVLPRPELEITLAFEMSAADALNRVHQLARQSLPISATCFDDERLYVRLSGTEGTISAARQLLGGDETDADVRLMLATLYRRIRRWEAARSELALVATYDPQGKWQLEVSRERILLHRESAKQKEETQPSKLAGPDGHVSGAA